MKGLLGRFLKDQSGAVIVDYGLVVAGIAVAVIAATWAAGGGVRNTLATLSNFLASASK